MKHILYVVWPVVAAAGVPAAVMGQAPEPGYFRYLRSPSSAIVNMSLDAIDRDWHPGAAVMLVESSRFVKSRTTHQRILALLEKKTGQKFGRDHSAWFRWIWSQKYNPHPEYAQFKSDLYSSVDSRFSEYFTSPQNATIRLDEIRWGGVKRDGIPPLRNPEMISAAGATYLGDSNEVFGVELNGEVRCYPKRILAWHEMFTDTIGGESFCGVY